MSLIAIDLISLWSDLNKRVAHGKIRSTIRRFEASASAVRDLEDAALSLSTLEQIDQQAEGQHRSVVGRGLLMHAVVVYARATHSQGDGRVRFDVSKAFSQEQRSTHEDVILLRNKSFAHFGTGDKGRFGEGWHDEKTVFAVSPEGRNVIAHYRTGKSYSGEIVVALSDLIERALPFANEKREELHRELYELLRAQLHEDEAFRETIRAHIFAPEALQGGSPSLEELLKSGETDLRWGGYKPAS